MVTLKGMALGLTLAAGYTSGVSTLGGCAGASWPSNGKLPERVVDKLTDCGRKGPTPLESVSYDLTFTVHVTEDDQEARVDDVMLTDSTLHLPEVEACMIDALYGMHTPLEALALRQRKLSPDPIVGPGARAMLSQVQVVQLLEVMALIVVGYAAYTVIVQVIVDKHHPKPRPRPAIPETEEPPAPALATATTTPIATAVPTVTAIPTAAPVSRKDACRDMFAVCQAKAGRCTRVTTRGHTICRICQIDCLAGKAYSYNECYQCGFQ